MPLRPFHHDRPRLTVLICGDIKQALVQYTVTTTSTHNAPIIRQRSLLPGHHSGLIFSVQPQSVEERPGGHLLPVRVEPSEVLGTVKRPAECK